MMDKSLLVPDRIRRIQGSFAYIEHRFLRESFWQSLSHLELLLYFFLILVADRNGISFYSYDKICTLLRTTLDDYLRARNSLIAKDLLAFDGHLFQVLSLPEAPPSPVRRVLKTAEDMLAKDPATVHMAICDAMGADPDESIRQSSPK
jgi:hypothetical protein